MNNSLSITRKNSLIIMCIYILFSVQNRFFDELFSIFNMDMFSLLLSIVLISYVIYGVYIKRIKIDKIFLFMSLLIVYKLLIGIIEGNKIILIFIDARTTLYFLCAYLIFKYNRLEKDYLIKIIKTGGLVNSLLFIYFMLKMINQSHIGFRDVSFNLYISFLSLSVILLIDKKSIYNINNIIIVILNIVAIFLSQQRTLIIPLIILFIIFIINNIKLNIKNIISLIVMIIFSYLCLRYLDNIGVLQLVINRFSPEAFGGESSTLNIRNQTMINAFKETDIRNLIFGCGFGAPYSELELLIPNYIIKYGIIGMLFIVNYFLYNIINRFNRYTSFQKYILKIYIIMLTGGVISGFGGASGQMLMGIILAILTTDNFEKNIK